MGLTISGTQAVGVHLTSASQNPVTVTSTGAITTTGSYAIYGSATVEWTVSNRGYLSGRTYGVTLAGGGRITNGSTSNTSASILGGVFGIVTARAEGSIANYGTISGIDLAYGGVITNETHAMISHQIVVGGTQGYVTNFGTIAAPIGGGVVFDALGTLVNGSASATTASVSGSASAVANFSYPVKIVNYGTLQSQ